MAVSQYGKSKTGAAESPARISRTMTFTAGVNDFDAPVEEGSDRMDVFEHIVKELAVVWRATRKGET